MLHPCPPPPPPPTPLSPSDPLPFTLPQEYSLTDSPLVDVGLTCTQDYWSQNMMESAAFQWMRLHLWKSVHSRCLARDASSVGASDDTSLEDDFKICLKDNFSPHPNFYSSKVSRFYDFISKSDTFAAQDFDGGSSSRYYNDLYAGGHSFLENVRDSAIAVGNGVIDAKDADTMAIKALDALLEDIEGNDLQL